MLFSIKQHDHRQAEGHQRDVSLFQKLIESLTIPERWKMRLKRHFWRPKYFEDLLNRLETNSDVDPVAVDLDKKKFSEMKNLDQSKEIASRKVSEILSRFDRKIKDPRSFRENKKIVAYILGGPNKYYSFSEKQMQKIFIMLAYLR